MEAKADESELTLETAQDIKQDMERRLSEAERPATIFVPLTIAPRWVEASRMVLAANLFGVSINTLSNFALALLQEGCLSCREGGLDPDFHCCQTAIDPFLNTEFYKLTHLFNVDYTHENFISVRDSLLRRTVPCGILNYGENPQNGRGSATLV